jgi:ribonuclease G
MAKEMVISAAPHETRVAIMEDGQLFEIYVERQKEFALVGSIYKGRVTRVLPGMQSAFVEIGLDTDAFLYVSDFLEDLEEFDQIVHTVEDKVQRIEDQRGEAVSSAEVEHGTVFEPSDVDNTAPAAVPPPVVRSVPEQAGLPATPPRDAGRPSRPDSRNRRGPGGRGHFGRHGRRDGRWGRELPSSKFANQRPPEPEVGNQETAIPGAEAGYEPIILPGESLAKYRGRVPSPPQETEGIAGAGERLEPVSEEKIETLAAQPPAPMVELQPEFPSQPEHRPSREILPTSVQRESRGNAPRFSSTAHIEPLPGESIAKARASASMREETPARREEAGAATAPAYETPAARNGEAKAAVSWTQPESQEEPSMRDTLISAAEAPETNSLREERAEGSTAISREVSAFQKEHIQGLKEPSSTPDASGEMESAEASVELETLEHEHHVAETEEAFFRGEEEPESASLPEQSAEPSQARVSTDFRARMHQPGRRGQRDQRGGRRQNRDQRPSRGNAQPARRQQLIAEMLKAGEEIIVQIAKEPLGKKGARITSHVALPGRFLVYMPTLHHTGVSRKISSAEERLRLRQLVTQAQTQAGGGGGFIVRTAASHADPEEVRADVEFLMRTWAEIKARSEQRRAPSLLHRDLNLVERLLRDYLNDDYSTIWVDNEEEYAKVVDFVSRFQPKLLNRVRLYGKDTPIFEEFGIQQEIDKALRPKVWLKSGGHIVINHTEALVAIDVNTGKFVGRGSTRLEDTIVKTNLEAVKEVVRQIRLRDLGGIIVIDFIDMDERRNREKVMAALEEALKTDRSPSKVLRFNEFGLVAITRKRTKQALERTLCQPCPYCTGSGMVKSVPTLCYEIQTEARKMAPEMESNSVTLRVHPEIAKALKTREAALIEELEHWTKKHVIIQADPTLHWEQYDIY